MKRFVCLVLSLLFLAACGSGPREELFRPLSEEEVSRISREAAELLLPTGAQTQTLTPETAALLLDVDPDRLAGAWGFVSLDNSTTAQLMVLKPAEADGEKLLEALRQRLELVRQTAEAVGGASFGEEWQGIAFGAGNYALLAVADCDPQAAQKTEQARQMLTEALGQTAP